MVLWAVFAVLTGIAVLAVLAPMTRARSAGRSGRESDVAVYKDQLREIDADLSRGVVDAREAEAARAEVGRRLLAADKAAKSGGRPVPPLPRAAIAAVIVLLPAASVGLYLAFGSPGLPGQPLSARLDRPAQDQDVDILVARVEEHLAANPEDGNGWEVLAPVLMRVGRFEEAARARANALRLLGPTPDREADYGEALVAVRDGLVTQDARAAFARALALDPKLPKARYFVAIAAEQDGDTETAARLWNELLADSPADAPWRGAVEGRLAALDAPAAPGPTADDVAAAADLPSEDRAAMIAGMVERLADRLAEDGKDLDGWLRLARAYVVLGEPDRARAALSQARRNYPGDAAAAGRIDRAARELGLGSS